MTEVTRAGDVVFRSRGPGSAQVERFLAFLEREGFEYAPRFLGISPDDRQMLSYVPGDAGDYPLPENLRGQATLRSAAEVLRRLHDVGSGVAESVTGGWMLPDVHPAEVVCHGDFAPYNCVFDGERVTGVIDFDAAHTGPRLWDIAYAVYRFVPLADPRNPVAFGTLQEQAERTRVFCDEYGLKDRSGLVDTVCARLHALIDFMRAEAAAGHAAFSRHLDEGHDLTYLRDIEYLRRNEDTITSIVTGPGTG
ncbi:aminoglycoside phosphotransferase family protein [Spirillospora sp. NPDC052269]